MKVMVMVQVKRIQIRVAMFGMNYKKTVTNEINHEGSLQQDAKNKTGTVGKKIDKTVTNESKGAVGNELEKNIMSESNGDFSRNKDTSIPGTLSNTLEENILNESNGDDSVEQDTHNKSGIVGNEFEESVTNESNVSVGMELEDNVTDESNADCSRKEDTSINGSVTNKLKTTVMT